LRAGNFRMSLKKTRSSRATLVLPGAKRKGSLLNAFGRNSGAEMSAPVTRSTRALSRSSRASLRIHVTASKLAACLGNPQSRSNIALVRLPWPWSTEPKHPPDPTTVDGSDGAAAAGAAKHAGQLLECVGRLAARVIDAILAALRQYPPIPGRRGSRARSTF